MHWLPAPCTEDKVCMGCRQPVLPLTSAATEHHSRVTQHLRETRNTQLEIIESTSEHTTSSNVVKPRKRQKSLG